MNVIVFLKTALRDHYYLPLCIHTDSIGVVFVIKNKSGSCDCTIYLVKAAPLFKLTRVTLHYKHT